MISTFPLQLVRHHMLHASCRHLAFERADGESFAFVPGQFLQIHFEHQERLLKRSYSIATRVGDPQNLAGQIEIAVSYVDGGAATALLSGLQLGDVVQASGPYGRFVLQAADRNARYLLIATGTGVTPYRAMLPEIERRILSTGQRFVVLFGARQPEELLYAEEFEAFAARHPQHFEYRACLSRIPRAQPKAHDREGRVIAQFEQLAPNAEQDIAYLCGNPDMVDEGFERLKQYGLAVSQIRREKYISPK